MNDYIVVEGLADVQRALAKAERDVRLGFRQGLRGVAEPVRAEAEQLSLSEIRNMPRSPQWARQRTGVTRNLVYVAPRQKGTRGRGDPRRRRPNLADLMMTRAMQPSLRRHQAQIANRFNELLDRMARDFNRA